MDTFSLLLDVFDPIRDAEIIDIGCGHGHLSKRLCDVGAKVTGVDPSDAAVATARQAAPEARFVTGRAERLPFADDSFGHAVFLNSLHHIEPDKMDAALRESLRVVRANGAVLVIEPVAAGSFFDVFRIIEDETAVRRRAQESIEVLARSGRVRVVRRLAYDRVEKFADLAAFVDRIADVDPARRSAIAEHHDELADLFEANAAIAEDGRRCLIQPLVAVVLQDGAAGQAR